MGKDKPIVLSVGGSLIIPNGGVDTRFLQKFNEFIRKKIAEGWRFFLVVGGGQTARHYRDAGRAITGKVTNDDLDWLGIHATRINAHLVRTVFKDIAHPKVIDRYDRKYDIGDYPVIVCSGWKPGWSTDYDAVLLAQSYNAKTVVNLSNVKMVYDKDPAKNKDAVPIERTSWSYFLSLIGEKWDPGLNVPFDPIASKLAQKLGLTVIILKGDNFANLDKVFTTGKFEGTVIAPLTPEAAFYNREYFDGGKASEYKTSLRYKILRTIRDVFRVLAIKIFLHPKTVLDVGCGTGEIVRYFRFLGIEAYGLEINKHLLSQAKPDIKKFLKHGNVLALPYKDSSFELVTTFNVLGYISPEDLKTAVSECNRVTKNLVLHEVLTVENWWGKTLFRPDISLLSIFSQSWWEKFFKGNGFKRAKISFPHPPHFIKTSFILSK